MADGPLLEAVRAAFASDLAEQVRALEEGIVALEKAAGSGDSAELLRQVFRAAHGLKGAARAAGLAPVEEACHAMESLLGAARDERRALLREDFAAMLSAVDALAGLQRRLADDLHADPDAEAFAAAVARLRERLAAQPGAPDGAADSAGGSESGSDAVAVGEAAPETAETRPASATAAAASEASATEASASSPAHDRAARPPVPQPPAPAAQSPAPTFTPVPAGPPAATQAASQETHRRRTALRITPERLDELGAAAAALVAVAQGPTTRTATVEQAVRDVRRARSMLGPAANEQLRPVERALLSLRAELLLQARFLRQRTSRLAATVRSLRLTSWVESSAGLDRLVRDLADSLGKEAEVVVLGEGLELDKSLVDVLREPLAQLVRNAIDHGIEAPAEREAAGKARRGTIEVAARVDGERVFVTVRDDGRGLDPAVLREAARRRGMEAPEDEQAALELVFEPGFSTLDSATAVSGRGVGLDVVASAVRAVRGDMSVTSTVGRGTRFQLVLPATQYGLRALVARDGGQAFAFAATDVERVVRLAGARTATSGGRAMLLAGDPAPLVPLTRAVGLDGDDRPRRMAVVVDYGRRRAAFAVEEVVTEQELGLEPLGPRFSGVPVANGVAVLPDGELALVLTSRELVAMAQGVAAPALPVEQVSAQPLRRKVLVADDSATTRTLARSILESAGYDVIAAPDGEQAWVLLQKEGADLVVSDVEMPAMDGVGLTRAMRGSGRFSRTPVVLLTALASESDRRRGMEAGADAYLVKSGFDQRVLLETIAELLEGRS